MNAKILALRINFFAQGNLSFAIKPEYMIINEFKIKMICSLCHSEINDLTLSFCPVCGAQIEGDEEYVKTKFVHPWALVYTTNTDIHAAMLKANLEGAGIPVRILSQVDTVRMLTVGNLAIVKIYVPSPFYTDALEIVKTIENEGAP